MRLTLNLASQLRKNTIKLFLHKKTCKVNCRFFPIVGVTRFELATPRPPDGYATRLRYTPNFLFVMPKLLLAPANVIVDFSFAKFFLYLVLIPNSANNRNCLFIVNYY